MMARTQFIIQLFVILALFTGMSSSEEIWCDFEQSICSWTQYTEDDFDWSRRCGRTASSGTGPTNGQGGLQCDPYLYIETSSPRQPGDSARIISEPLYNVDAYYCLTFWYHMYGVDVEALSVLLTTDDFETGNVIWAEYYQKGNQWYKAEQSFRITSAGTRVVFQGIRGYGYRGDIAIDTIAISSHICPSDVLTTLEPTTTILHITGSEIGYLTTLKSEYETVSETITTAITEENGILTTQEPTSRILHTAANGIGYLTSTLGHETFETPATATRDENVTDKETAGTSYDILTVEVNTVLQATESITDFITDGQSEQPLTDFYISEITGSIQKFSEPVVICADEHIIVEIPKEIFGESNVTALHLLDPNCKPVFNDSYVTFEFSTTSCGTLSQVNAEEIVYTNLIERSIVNTDGIIRDKEVWIPISCSYDRKKIVGNEFVPVFDQIAFGASGKGDFNFDMEFYQDDAFETELQDPIIARIGDMMYFGLSVDISDENVILYADNCKALSKDTPANSYYIIQDGCMRDSTMQQYPSNSAHRRLFGVEAFMFLSSGSEIFLECDVVLCDERDGISRCPSCQTMASDRKRRDATDDKIIKSSVTRTLKLIAPDDDKVWDNTSKKYWLTPSNIIATVMFIMAAILCIVTMIKRKQVRMIHSELHA